MTDLANTGVPRGEDYDNCSHSCLFYWPVVDEVQLHDPACWSLEPRTKEQREATRQEYKDLRVEARRRAGQKAYREKNDL